MGYLKDLHGYQSIDFVEVFLAAMDAYAIWKDGKRWIGSPERELREAMREAITELGHEPKHCEDIAGYKF